MHIYYTHIPHIPYVHIPHTHHECLCTPHIYTHQICMHKPHTCTHHTYIHLTNMRIYTHHIHTPHIHTSHACTHHILVYTHHMYTPHIHTHSHFLPGSPKCPLLPQSSCSEAFERPSLHTQPSLHPGQSFLTGSQPPDRPALWFVLVCAGASPLPLCPPWRTELQGTSSSVLRP